MKDVDLLGSDIQFFNDIQTWEGCEDRCSNNPDCKSWTWVSTSYNLNTDIIFKCHLKNGFPSPSKVAGLISGYSQCKSKAKPGKEPIIKLKRNFQSIFDQIKGYVKF